MPEVGRAEEEQRQGNMKFIGWRTDTWGKELEKQGEREGKSNWGRRWGRQEELGNMDKLDEHWGRGVGLCKGTKGNETRNQFILFRHWNNGGNCTCCILLQSIGWSFGSCQHITTSEVCQVLFTCSGSQVCTHVLSPSVSFHHLLLLLAPPFT